MVSEEELQRNCRGTVEELEELEEPSLSFINIIPS
jgi:hypothetical protein